MKRPLNPAFVASGSMGPPATIALLADPPNPPMPKTGGTDALLTTEWHSRHDWPSSP